ncbi:MAG: prolyl oligopeptidase family serine peptidase [Archangiaceae bacterium]|nr:prolyl oligopeptidase family serine peptidase [Archangiaceae bacterium]
MRLTRREVLAASAPLVLGATARGGWEKSVEVKGPSGVSTVDVYVPAVKAGEKLPLVIALHGWAHTPELWRQKADLGPLAEQHRCVIALPAMGKSIYETRFYPQTKSSWVAGPGTPWVGEVVLPFLRARYPVRADREHTALVGYSTGGRGAVLVAEAYAEHFGFAGSLSGTFDLMRLEPAEGEYKIHAAMYGERETFPKRWVDDNCIAPSRLAALSRVRVFARHGEADSSVKPNQLTALRDALEGTAVKADLAMVAGAGHDWKFWGAQQAPMLSAAASGW